VAYKLINARPSPFGRKVEISMREKSIEYEVQYDVPWGENTCTPQYSPLEQLPILITEKGENVYDSGHIINWLETYHPSPALLPEDRDARIAVQTRRLLGERLMEIAQSLMFELFRPQPSTAWVDRQTRKVRGGLDELEKLYGEYTVQTEIGVDLGDLAVGTTLLGLEFGLESGLAPEAPVLHWRESYPTLDEAVSRLELRPSFVATKPQMMDVNLGATVS